MAHSLKEKMLLKISCHYQKERIMEQWPVRGSEEILHSLTRFIRLEDTNQWSILDLNCLSLVIELNQEQCSKVGFCERQMSESWKLGAEM